MNSLHGLRVLNTRPLKQSEALTQAIQAAGGISISLPALSIEPTTTDWIASMPALTSTHQAIFVSSNAVDYFFDALKAAHIIWPTNICVTAIGSATAQALVKHGITVDHLPVIADSEHLLALDTFQSIKNQIIMLIKGCGGRQLIAEEIINRGAQLTSLMVYRSVCPEEKPEFTNSVWQDDAVDIILITSQQAMQHLFTLFAEPGRKWLINKPCLVISARLAEMASLLGIKTIITSHYDEVLSTLIGYTKQKDFIHDNSK